MKTTYKAVLLSPDGADHVTDFRGSPTVQSVWDAIDNMGSRWFFYPVPFVVSERTEKVARGGGPFMLECAVGMTVPEVHKLVKANTDVVACVFLG